MMTPLVELGVVPDLALTSLFRKQVPWGMGTLDEEQTMVKSPHGQKMKRNCLTMRMQDIRRNKELKVQNTLKVCLHLSVCLKHGM